MLAWLERLVANSDQADLRWLSASGRLWCVCMRAPTGDHQGGLALLDASINAVEHGFLGAPPKPASSPSLAAWPWSWGRQGVRVNAVGPAFFPTAQSGFLQDPDQVRWIRSHNALKRTARLDELDGTIVFSPVTCRAS